MPPVRGHTFQGLGTSQTFSWLSSWEGLLRRIKCLDSWRKHVGLLACSLLIWKDDEQKFWFLQPLFSVNLGNMSSFPWVLYTVENWPNPLCMSHPLQSGSWNMWTSLLWWQLLQGSLWAAGQTPSSQASYLLPHHYCSKFKYISLSNHFPKRITDLCLLGRVFRSRRLSFNNWH